MLTPQTYFSDPSYLHSHQLKCYLDSKELYKLRHIDKNPDFQFNRTPAVILGSIVDELLTEGKTGYYLKTERADKDPMAVTNAVWENAMTIVEHLPKHPIWDTLKSGEMQKIVEGEIGGMKVAGKLDSYVKGVGILDLKVSSEACAKTPQAWYWHSRKMGWHIPAFVYSYLLGESIPFYHLAVYLKNGLVFAKLYHLTPDVLALGAEDTLNAIAGIKAGDFSPDLCSLDSAIDLSATYEQPVDNEEEDEF